MKKLYIILSILILNTVCIPNIMAQSASNPELTFNNADSLIKFLTKEPWAWARTYGGFDGREITPKSLKYNKLLIFKSIPNETDSISYEVYHNDSLVVKDKTKIFYNSNNQKWYISYIHEFKKVSQPQYLTLNYDNFVLNGGCCDQYSSVFLRQSLTNFTFSLTGLNSTTISGIEFENNQNYTFTGTKTSQIVSFYVNSYTGYSYKWYFGDGDSSDIASPVHIFSKVASNAKLPENCLITTDSPTSVKSCSNNYYVTLKIEYSGTYNIEFQKTLLGINYNTETKNYLLISNNIEELANADINILNLGDSYKISFQNIESKNIEIYSLTGQKVFSASNIKNEFSIHKNELTSGINILSLEIAGKRKYFKLMKE